MLGITVATLGRADHAFKVAPLWTIDAFGPFCIVAVAVLLAIVPALGFGPAAKLKLGPDDAGPVGWRVRCRQRR